VELFLNLAWLAVAVTILGMWLHRADRSDPHRRLQLIAIVVLIAILFPVISVSDDLLAIQSASETDNYLRRDHLVPSDPHPVPSVFGAVPRVLFAGLGQVFLRFVCPAVVPLHEAKHPELASIDNRPPPAV
jgi:hypothetical protein